MDGAEENAVSEYGRCDVGSVGRVQDSKSYITTLPYSSTHGNPCIFIIAVSGFMQQQRQGLKKIGKTYLFPVWENDDILLTVTLIKVNKEPF